LKIGGSLQSYPASLTRLCRAIAGLTSDHSLIVVPGGGVFADAVRRMQKRFRLSEEPAHRMALLGMDQNAHLLAELIGPSAIISEKIDEVESQLEKGHCVVMQVFDLFSRDRSLEPSWRITSDTLACHVAGRVHAMGLVLLKAVDGLSEPRDSRSIIPRIPADKLVSMDIMGVDEALPACLKTYGLIAYVISGRWPSRLRGVLSGAPTKGTIITP